MTGAVSRKHVTTTVANRTFAPSQSSTSYESGGGGCIVPRGTDPTHWPEAPGGPYWKLPP